MKGKLAKNREQFHNRPVSSGKSHSFAQLHGEDDR